MRFEHDVPLAPLTTLGLGGSARRLVEVTRAPDVAEVAREASRAGERLLVLGGGSNLVVRDEGWDGLVMRVGLLGVEVEQEADSAVVSVAAGEPWDDFVGRMVDEGLSGVECLSGIPGLVGATPMQNVGAYGQEVSDTIVGVVAFDREREEILTFSPEACDFSYRSSLFKGKERWVVLEVRFRLKRNRESAPVRYAELSRALGVPEGARAPLGEVRRTVVALRRGKGMVVDPSDPESKSAGSFFMNPILDARALDELRVRVADRLGREAQLPSFDAPGGRTKVSAAWLIERAGFAKGYGTGPVGISKKHALALVHRGGATTAELLALAREIQAGVRGAFGVELEPEPVVVGAPSTERRAPA
jgi:UDP-N-acetylmuramate dehydrogenase